MPRRARVLVLATATLLAGCGSGGGGHTATSASPATSAKTVAGAKATLLAFADAYVNGDGARACPLIAQDVKDELKGTKMSCEESIAGIKAVLTPADAERFKAAAAAQTPTVSGNTASLAGRGVVLVYQGGRWLVTSAGVK